MNDLDERQPMAHQTASMGPGRRGGPGRPGRRPGWSPDPPARLVLVVGSIAAIGAILLLLNAGRPGPIAGEAIGGASANPSVSPARSSAASSPASTPTFAVGASPAPSGTPSPSPQPVSAGPFAGYLMIADHGNGRILIVDPAGRIHWRFPGPGSLSPGQHFSADDAFLSPDGKTIMANEEERQVIVRIDIATRRIIWEYGHFDVLGSTPGYLHTPDDAYPLANGDVIVADIGNCRVIQISPAKEIVHQWGRAGVCVDHPPQTYGYPNGDTPLPDGGILITEIQGSRIVRLDRLGTVIFDIHVPLSYPSDAQLDANGDILVVDYANRGAILKVDHTGKVLWRYSPRSGPGRLDHPSLAITLPNGLIAVNDDFRHRVVIIDPQTNRIVWQYGHTDRHGTAAGYLFTPDGIDLIPPDVAATL